MKVFKAMSKVVKPFVNFPQWMGLKQITTTTRDLKDIVKVVFRTKEKAKDQETFEQAFIRLGLNEEMVQQRIKKLQKLSIYYVLFGITLVAYTVYLIVSTDYILAPIMTLILSALMFTYAYREHFWYFQMKTRKLGCNFKDWSAFVLKKRVK